MDEIRGSSSARRLSQILDPITRLASDFGSSSAPCSPRLGARVHDASGVSVGQQQSGSVVVSSAGVPPSSRTGPSGVAAASGGSSSGSGPDSPRLWPRQFRQAPTPPPRPRHTAVAAAATTAVSTVSVSTSTSVNINNNNNNNVGVSANSGVPITAIHARDSPYVNVPNLFFHKDKSFTESARSAGYVELREKPKCSPYDFTSESSGHVEYADKRTYVSPVPSDLVYEMGQDPGDGTLCRGRTNLEPGPSSGSRAHFDRAFSFSGRQPPEQAAPRLYETSRLYVDPRTAAGSVDLKREKLDIRPGYGSSKSFDGYTTTVEELRWQERCLELQLELHRSRSQATRVRDMLREKVSLFTSEYRLTWWNCFDVQDNAISH